ncbi:MAG TPA: hypothetical protein VLN56_10555 [Gammaproteobacteria bacterium]|nr:hypothetical protein [Gammaproteobacteria bacterium]
MISFTELLTASDDELVKIFYKIKVESNEDFIKRINKIAAHLGLNHAQLVCALGFNKNIRDLTDIISVLGFRSYKLLSYRQNELFTTDTYQQLAIDNIIDIYSERLEDARIKETLRELLMPRLEHIEKDIEKTEDPSHVISYRMEIHAIYTSGIADKAFAEKRVSKNISKFRIMANEVGVIVDTGLIPASNLFFMDSVSPEEKKELIDANHISMEIVKNRLQNSKISEQERDMLESYI